MAEELAQRIIKVIAETQRMPAEKITVESTFEELGIDSLDGVNIVFGLENEFDMTIPDEDVKGIRSVKDIVEKLEAWRLGKVKPGRPPLPGTAG